jgi:hypothetical protein
MQMAKLAEWIVAGVIAAAPLAQAQQGGADEARIKRIVDGIVQPAMQADVIPGVGVGITLHGKHYFFGYGQATDDGALPRGHGSGNRLGDENFYHGDAGPGRERRKNVVE